MTASNQSETVIALSDRSPDKVDMSELGMSPLTPGGMPWTTAAGSDSNTVLNRPIVTVKELTQMRRRDGQAKALFQLITLPLRLALGSGTWIDPDSKGETPEAKFANQMWNLPPNAGGMTTSKSKLIRQILLALFDGFSAFEIVRQVPDKGPLKGKVTLRKLAYRDPNTVQFLVDPHGGYRGFHQITQLANMDPVDVIIKPEKSLIYTHGDEQNPYYGISLFESAYPHWDAKRKLYYIAHLASQFAAVPGRVGEYPRDAEAGEIRAFRKSVQDFALNTSLVHREGFKVTPFNGNTGYNFLTLIDHHNTQMSKSVLASFFDNEQRTVLIENGASQSADADLFLLSMKSIADDIAETLSTYLMPQFIDLNFSSDRYPIFKPGAMSEETEQIIRDLFDKLVVSSILNSTPEMVRELEKKVSAQLGLDIDYGKIEKREQEAVQQQQEQAQAEADAQAQQQAAAPPDTGAAPNGTGGAPDPAQQQAANQQATAQQLAASAPSELYMDALDTLILQSEAIQSGSAIYAAPTPVDDF